MTDPAPLILTLALDPAAFAYFDARRRRHFPPERNLIPAHLTLFHALPGAEAATILRDLDEACARRPPLTLSVTGLRSLGRGVAYRIESPDLAALRRDLAARWSAWLTPQDRQPHQPHVTVQNKVDPAAARATLAELAAAFAPFGATGSGLDLWRYRGGPWEAVAHVAFAAPTPPWRSGWRCRPPPRC
jgi:2'-5' RNA ligase